MPQTSHRPDKGLSNTIYVLSHSAREEYSRYCLWNKLMAALRRPFHLTTDYFSFSTYINLLLFLSISLHLHLSHASFVSFLPFIPLCALFLFLFSFSLSLSLALPLSQSIILPRATGLTEFMRQTQILSTSVYHSSLTPTEARTHPHTRTHAPHTQS